MVEGWHGDEYLILFEESDWELVANRYDLGRLLPNFQVLGLRGWDDFVVRDTAARTYTVPTVPLALEFLTPYHLAANSTLAPDARFTGKIKWYLQPIVFGGDQNPGPNLAWVSHEQHGELVRFWNEKYRTKCAER